MTSGIPFCEEVIGGLASIDESYGLEELKLEISCCLYRLLRAIPKGADIPKNYVAITTHDLTCIAEGLLHKHIDKGRIIGVWEVLSLRCIGGAFDSESSLARTSTCIASAQYT